MTIEIQTIYLLRLRLHETKWNVKFTFRKQRVTIKTRVMSTDETTQTNGDNSQWIQVETEVKEKTFEIFRVEKNKNVFFFST